MTKAKKIGLRLAAVLMLLIAVGGVGAFMFSRTHKHCIKTSGLALRQYVDAHNGKFPFHTNGYGDALLLLVTEDPLEMGPEHRINAIRYITGPGDDGAYFEEALQNKTDVAEDRCSRVYVQGLSEKNNPQLAILFDKRSTPGGDHFRNFFGRSLREACLLDGSMQTIPDDRWPAFVKAQIELLVQEGFDRSRAEAIYSGL